MFRYLYSNQLTCLDSGLFRSLTLLQDLYVNSSTYNLWASVALVHMVAMRLYAVHTMALGCSTRAVWLYCPDVWS